MRRGQPGSGKRANSEFRFRPFRQLGQFKPRRTARVVEPEPPPVRVADPESESDLYAREMAGVRPLDNGGAARVPQRPVKQPREITAGEAEALATLSDLVAGAGTFDITDTSEYLEGCVVGLDPRVLRRLRTGVFAYQNHLDLHRMTVEAARVAVDQFLVQAQREGHRCVLIVHGRGFNSQGQIPVLKNWLAGWLARGPWARLVLAFTSARACDGGLGALYVLLRRSPHRKRPIRVTMGAKF